MNRIFQRTVRYAMIVTIASMVFLCGYNTYVYIYKELTYIHKKHAIALHKEEAVRMQALAKNAHKKCPSDVKITRLTHRTKNFQIPAYPHLSDIYVYILPETLVNKYPIYKGTFPFQPLKKDHLQTLINLPNWKDKKSSLDKLFESLQPNAMPTLFIKALEQSLSYCGEKNGNPLKIKIVDKIQHDNLEQKDALTITVGVIIPFKSESQYKQPWLYTSQYIPRWKIFPDEHQRIFSPRKVFYYKNNPFRINNHSIDDVYEPFFTPTKENNPIEGWLTHAWLRKGDTASPSTWKPKEARLIHASHKGKRYLRKTVRNKKIKDFYNATILYLVEKIYSIKREHLFQRLR